MTSPRTLQFFWATAPVYGDRQDDVVDHHAGTRIAVAELSAGNLRRLLELLDEQDQLARGLPDGTTSHRTVLHWRPVHYAVASRKELEKLNRSRSELRELQAAFFDWCNEQYRHKGPNVARGWRRGLTTRALVDALNTDRYDHVDQARVTIDHEGVHFARSDSVQRGGTGVTLDRPELLAYLAQLVGENERYTILDELVKTSPEWALDVLEGLEVIGQEDVFRSPPSTTTEHATRLLTHEDGQVRQRAMTILGKGSPVRPEPAGDPNRGWKR